MLPINRTFFHLVMVSLAFGQVSQPHADKPNPLRTRAYVVEQRYCRADADLFTVSLRLDVEVSNASKTPTYVRPTMIPWVGKVAATIADAQSGHYLYEITGSHYPRGSSSSGRLRIAPRKSVMLHTGYDLVARYNAEFSYPKSLSPGSYAIVLVLKPETQPPSRGQRSRIVESLTTEPFLIEVPKHPKLVNCEGPPGLVRHP
jgi:hypothetical protein